MDKIVLIHKVLSRTATDDERSALAAWVDADDIHREEYEAIRLLWEGNKALAQVDRDAYFHDGLYQIRIRIMMRRKCIRRRRNILVAAAVVIVAALVFVSAYFWFSRNRRPSDRYVFRQEQVRHVVSILERDYGIHIDVKDVAVLDCRFTGMFYNASAETVIRAMSGQLALSYTVNAKGIYELSGRGCDR